MAVKDVVDPFAGACFFECDYIFWLFDDADERFVAAGVGADLADRCFGKIVTDFAGFGFVFDVTYGFCKCHRFVFICFKDVKGESFGGFWAYAGQLFEFGDEPVETFGIDISHNFFLRRFREKTFSEILYTSKVSVSIGKKGSLYRQKMIGLYNTGEIFFGGEAE